VNVVLVQGGLAGVLLSAAVAAVAWVVWGSGAATAAAAFGLVATAIQFASARLVIVARGARFPLFAQRWAWGMLLRLAGVALIPIAGLLARETFPPPAASLGYLGVLLPLLYWETRLVR
jgi:hypothetical protein